MFKIQLVVFCGVLAVGLSSYPSNCPNLEKLRYGNDVFEFQMFPPHPNKYKALTRSKGFITNNGSLSLQITGRGEKFVIYKLCVRTKGVSEIHLVYQGWLPPKPIGFEGETRQNAYARSMMPGFAREKVEVKVTNKLRTTCIGSRGVNSKIYIQLLHENLTKVDRSTIIVKDVKLIACILDNDASYEDLAL